MLDYRDKLADVMQELFDLACNQPFNLIITTNPDDLDSLWTAEIQMGENGPSFHCLYPEGQIEDAIRGALEDRKEYLRSAQP